MARILKILIKSCLSHRTDEEPSSINRQKLAAAVIEAGEPNTKYPNLLIYR